MPWVSARREIRTPAAVRGDLALPFAEDRLPEDSQHPAAVVEGNLADAETGGLLLQDAREPGGRHGPHLDSDRRAALRHAHHRGMFVADRPETIDGRGAGLADEARARSQQIAVELEAAHQRAVHGEQDVHASSPRRFYAAPRAARGLRTRIAVA